MNKRVRNILIIMLILIIVIGGWVFFNREEDVVIEEYEPQEEISDEQLRQTIVSLYYKNKDTKELIPEGRLIDVKLLLDEPYTTLMQLLIDGPKNQNLEKCIPEGTKINKIEFVKQCSNIVTKDNFSEMLEYLNILLFKYGKENLKYLNSMEYINTAIKQREYNCNVEMILDNLFLEMYESLK